jgi:heat shock protein HtpX
MTERGDASDGLTRSILLTLGAVLAVNVAFVLLLALLARPWLDAVGAATGVPTLALVGLFAVVALGVVLWFEFRYTRREALAEAGAVVVEESDYPGLYDRLGRLARQADVARPELAVADSRVPNSFTVGGPDNAVVVVSEGLLATLPEDELDAVLAHELAHVKNRDAAVMTLASFLPALTSDRSVFAAVGGDGARVGAYLLGAALLYPLGVAAIPAPFGSLEYTVVFLALLALTAVLGSVALGVLSAPVLVLARRLSRFREFAADRAGAKTVGDPAALAGALRRLDEDVDVPRQDHRSVTGTDGVRGFCFMPYGLDDEPAGEEEFSIEWRSHPPVDARLDRLGEVAAELEASH